MIFDIGFGPLKSLEVLKDTLSQQTGLTLDSAIAKGTWTASGTWTLPAFTAGGAITVANGVTIGQAAGPLLTFDDTNNTLELTGCALVIGTNTFYGRLGQLLDINVSANYGGASVNTWSGTAAEASFIDFNRSKSASIGTYTVVATDDILGGIYFRGADGTDFQNSAVIRAVASGTMGADRVPGKLEFYAYTDAAPSVLTLILTLSGAGLGHLGISTVFTTATGVLFTETFNSPSEDKYGAQFNPTIGTTPGNKNLFGVKAVATFAGDAASSGLHWGILGRGYSNVASNLTATAANNHGLVGIVGDAYSEINGGTVTSLAALFAKSWGAATSGGTVTNAHGVYVKGLTAGGTVTNAYGIYVEAITGAGTLNYAIYTAGGLNHFIGNVNTVDVYSVDGTQVVGPRQVDARINDVPNSGDATTDGIIAAIQACVQTHGLMTAA